MVNSYNVVVKYENMDESEDELQGKMTESLDQTHIEIIDWGSAETIDEFDGISPPIPDEGDLLQLGWIATEEGETTADTSELFRVVERKYTYADKQNYDTGESGLGTIVTIFVIPD